MFNKDTIKTRQEHNAWKEWRASELERDVEYCHPRWPQEAQYVNAEIKAVRNLSLLSGSDYWIYFDWVALVFILATIVSHMVFFHYSTDLSKEVHHYITMPLLLVLWLRIFKYARPFESAGAFIVIFSSVVGDIMKWAFLNLVIVIPFTCAFWMTFGAISLNPVDGYNNVGPLLYNIFSMMVVNNHGFENLERTNPFMARLLCGSFIAIAAIVTLNLLIALLTNTFERVYENAIANAVMQRAQTILLLQKSLRQKQKSKYYNFIKEKASPEVISRSLGRLLTMDNDEATIEQLRDDIKAVMDIMGEQFGKKSRKDKKSDLNFMRMDMNKVRRFQEELIVDIRNMKLSFEEIKLKLEQQSVTSNTTLAMMKTTDNKNENIHNINEDGENDSNDESNTSSEDYDRDENGMKIQHNMNVMNTKRNNDNECTYNTNNKKKSKDKKKSKEHLEHRAKNTLDRKLGKVESKSRTKSHMENSQQKFRKNVKSSTETGSSETDSNSPNEEEGTYDITNEKVECRADKKKDKRDRKRRDKNDYQDKLKLGRKKKSQNEFSTLGERSFEISSENVGEVIRQRMAYQPHHVQSPLDDVPRNDPDVAQQRLMNLPGYLNTPLHNVPNADVSQQRLNYTTGQSQMSSLGMWKYTKIPYDHIFPKSFHTTHDQNQLIHGRQKKKDSSAPIQMQHELFAETSYDGKPQTVSTWTDHKQFSSDAMQQPLSYFPGSEFGKGEIPQNARHGQSVSIIDRNHSVLQQATPHITQNQPQVLSNAQQPSTKQHFQKPTTYASQNFGFETNGEFPGPIPARARYLPEYQMFALPQDYPQEIYDKNQRLSSTISHNQQSTTRRRSENRNVKSPNFQMSKQMFHEPLQHL